MKKTIAILLACASSAFSDTVTTTAAVASGTVSAGAYSVTFVASSDFAGTIDVNFAIPASAGLTITASKSSGGLDAIPYTRSAGTLTIIETRQ